MPNLVSIFCLKPISLLHHKLIPLFYLTLILLFRVRLVPLFFHNRIRFYNAPLSGNGLACRNLTPQ
jgi:hypothetical protein